MNKGSGVLKEAQFITGVCVALFLSVSSSAMGWSNPEPILRTGENSLEARVILDSQGNAHVAWREYVNDYHQIWYTHDASGSFETPVQLSQGDDMHCYQVDLDADGTDIHTVWLRKHDVGDNFEVWYRKKDSSTGWGSIYNASNTTGTPQWENLSTSPSIVARYGTNPIVAWQENIYAHDNYDIYLSEWDGDGFTVPPMNLSNTPYGSVYGSVKPNMTVSPDGVVTAVWPDRISGDYRINVRRLVDGTWTPREEISTLRNGPEQPGIDAAPNNDVWIAYRHEPNEYDWYIWVQRWDGTSWNDPVMLPGTLDHPARPKIAVDQQGYVHVVADAYTDPQNHRDIFYSNNRTGSWSAWENLSRTTGTGSVGADIFADDERILVVWSDTQGEQGGEGPYNTWQTYNLVNPGPPDPVVSFTVDEGNQRNQLNWTNPSSANFTGTMIRYKTTGFPTGPEDGTLLIDRAGYPDTTDSYTHTGLQNGQAYYYSAFAHDWTPNYATGVTAEGIPHVPGDFDHDNDIDMEDFGAFQSCLTGPFNPQEDPACIDALIDGDDDVDQDDMSIMIGCLSGPNITVDPGCVN